MKPITFTKGIYLMIIMQAVVLSSSIVMHFILGRLLGPVDYGRFGLIIYVINLIAEFLRKGVPLSANKYLSESIYNRKTIVFKSLLLQAILSFIFFFLLYFFADKIAILLNDQALSKYIKQASLIVPLTALFSLFNNFHSGLKQYKTQTLVNSLYSILKFILVIVFVALGYNLPGLINGLIIATSIALIVNISAFKLKKIELKYFSMKKIIKFAIPSIISSFLFLILISFDLFLLKINVCDDIIIGNYVASVTIAKIPYIIFGGAISVSLFPFISEAISNKYLRQVKIYIAKVILNILVLILPLTIFIGIFSKEIACILYSQKYVLIDGTLLIHSIAYFFITVIQIFLAIINASNAPKVSVIILGTTNIVFFLISLLLIPKYLAYGAGLSLLVASFFGALIAIVYVKIKFKIYIYDKKTKKILFIILIITCLGSLIKVTVNLTLPAFIFVSVLLLGLYIFWISKYRIINLKKLFKNQI